MRRASKEVPLCGVAQCTIAWAWSIQILNVHISQTESSFVATSDDDARARARERHTPSRPARVAHPYDAAEPWQLSAAEGDAVNILETHEDGWADVVTSDGARGMLPVSYLEE